MHIRSPTYSTGRPIRPPNNELRPPVGMMSIQAQASNLPSKVREERRTAYVVNKTNEIKIRQCPPEPLTALSPSSPPSAPPTQMPIPRASVSDEPAWESEAEQRLRDIISQDDETSAVQHIPKLMIALALPNRMPVLPAQAMAPCLSTDEHPLLVETA
jgi:hypothetical protein